MWSTMRSTWQWQAKMVVNARVSGADRAPNPCLECDVRSLAVCSAVRASLLPKLTTLAAGRHVDVGCSLFDEGDPADNVFTLTEGMLKLYKLLGDGRRQIVGFLVPGDFLGLAFGRGYAYTAEAVTPVAACRFKRQQFLTLLDECPELEKEILTRATTELAAAQEQMLLLGRKTARERVASFILAMSRRRKLAPGETLELPMGRADIGDYLGLTIETVSRTLTALRKERLIEVNDRHLIKVRQPEALARLAGS